MSGKKVIVSNNTRFVISIDGNFDKVSMIDLEKNGDKLSEIDCYNILQNNFNELVKIVKAMERKLEENKEISDKVKILNTLRLVK